MKKLIILTVLSICCGSLHGQGQMQFNNRVIGDVVAPIYGPEPSNPTLSIRGNPTNGTPAGTAIYSGSKLEGSGYTAQLWAAPNGACTNTVPESSLQAVLIGGTSTFRTGVAAGWFNASVAVIPGAMEGERATYQVRVWDNRGGTITSWSQVLADSTIPRGQSDVLTSPVLGRTLISPQPMWGFQSFNLTTLTSPTLVPEPSILALASLGIGFLYLHRRKFNAGS